ncbi:class F sortase [Kribbella caucasensis]|uniref:class F sortase n=1 Tax=Kribbella caucasensis TaxID=2512215 RepID=UPI00105DBE56|nr:class F sortase [Kribbella sp. VKM Ac-2527]
MGRVRPAGRTPADNPPDVTDDQADRTVHTGGGAFDDLDKLRVGAIVTVMTTTGPITYVTTSVTNHPKRSLAKHAAKVFDQTTPGRLVLVTCENWNGKVYLSNAVVIAEPVR